MRRSALKQLTQIPQFLLHRLNIALVLGNTLFVGNQAILDLRGIFIITATYRILLGKIFPSLLQITLLSSQFLLKNPPPVRIPRLLSIILNPRKACR